MAFNKKFLLATTFIAGFAVMAPSLAMAQTQPAAQQEEEDDDDNATQVGAVVITGSRIRRNEFTSSAPIQVITGDQAILEGMIDTAELLQQTTAASGSFQYDNTLTGFVLEGGPGINSISLRGLGANRTLFLLNGRRAGPAGTRGQVQAVDLNVIPASLMERTEVLTDSASTIYGSDAIAGVVNYITRTNLDGLEVSAFYRYPEAGDITFQRYNVGWGTTFDRGYFQAGFDYYGQTALTRGDRPGTACAEDYLFDPYTMERIDHRDQVTGQYQCYNIFAQALRANPGPGQMDLIYHRPGYNYAVPGNNSPIVGMARQARAGYPDTYTYYRGEHPLYDRATVISPVDRYTLTASGGFDLNPTTEVYGEFLYNQRRSEQDGVRQFFPTVWVGYPGARRPDTGGFFAGSTILPITPLYSDQDQVVDYMRGVLGIRGDFGAMFGGGWEWDLFGQYSRSDGDYTGSFIYNDRVIAVTGMAPGAGLTDACYSGPDLPNLSGYSCSQLPGGINWTSERILAGDFNQAERDFLFGSETGNTVYEHMYVEGVVNGDLFSLPAGVVGAAFGFHVRHESIDDQPGAMAQAGNYWGSTSAGRTRGDDTVREVFGELEIPLVRGFTGIEDLTLNLSGRFSDYDSYGSNSTYKVGLNWQITPAWRVRSTFGTGFRAPALYELYLANQTGFLSQQAVDPCLNYGDSSHPTIPTNCATGIDRNGDGDFNDPGDLPPVTDPAFPAGGSSATVTTRGGLGELEPETAEAFTFGVIWTPSFIDLSVAVDYFDILIEDAVLGLSASVVAQCYAVPTSQFATNPFCTFFTRSPTTGRITAIDNAYRNVNSQTNRGLDLNVRYGHEFSFGDLTIQGQATWQFEDIVALLDGSLPQDNNGETTEPDFTANLNIRFDRGDWTAFWSMNMFGKASDTEAFGGDVFANSRYASIPDGILSTNCDPAFAATNYCVYYKQYTEFMVFHNLSVQYRMDDWTFQAGVRNIFDEYNPNASSGQWRVGRTSYGIPGNDGLIGRSGFVSLTRRF